MINKSQGSSELSDAEIERRSSLALKELLRDPPTPHKPKPEFAAGRESEKARAPGEGG